MFKGFREFILRGNVIDLAVAIVIGTAFTAIVTSITENFIQPIIAALGGADVEGLTTQLRPGNPASTIDWAAILTAAINFLIVAAVVYFVFVAPMNRYREHRSKREPEPAAEPSEDTLLLREIRDLLAQRQPGQSPGCRQGGGRGAQGGSFPVRWASVQQPGVVVGVGLVTPAAGDFVGRCVGQHDEIVVPADAHLVEVPGLDAGQPPVTHQ